MKMFAERSLFAPREEKHTDLVEAVRPFCAANVARKPTPSIQLAIKFHSLLMF